MWLRRSLQYILAEASEKGIRLDSLNLGSAIKESPRNRHCAGEGLIPDSYWHGQERPDFAETASDVAVNSPRMSKSQSHPLHRPSCSEAPAAANCRKPTRPCSCRRRRSDQQLT